MTSLTTNDLFPSPTDEVASLPTVTKKAAVLQRMVKASTEIAESAPDNFYFHHSVLCQVGIPRKRTDERVFERRNGNVSVQLEAGKLFDGYKFVDQPLPYGTRPRLALVYASSFALKNKTRHIELGRSQLEFMKGLGIDHGGRSYKVMRQQTMALAASRMTIGMHLNGRAVTIKTDGPVEQFDAFMGPSGGQKTLWPDELVLSEKFYESLQDFSVPIDPRALGALADTALGMDVYTWLTHRLRRITQPNGLFLTWSMLHDQFGQEYSVLKDFKRTFTGTLRRVLPVYPQAKVESRHGGLQLFESPPPVSERAALPKTIP